MDHGITVGELLLCIGLVIGIVAMGFGLLMAFAGGMADAADDGTGRKGCIVFALALMLVIGCLIGMF